jgi:hypothetical protein
MSAPCCSVPPPSDPVNGPVAKPFLAGASPYRPLIIVALVSVMGAAAMHVGGRIPLMDGMMGLFFVLVAILKLFDLAGFAALFKRYDALAMRVPGYAAAYPFVELAVGILFLAGIWPVPTHLAAVLICAVAVYSVGRVIRTGQIINCACLGTSLAVPVGRVTLAEYGIMGAMAAIGLMMGIL